ncbi:Cyclic di-GMP phosphodiesterase Gmr [Legionella massiliensis]|uniref:Cyclic di-GMP phosphodiesterase Gmr n=1 Tax=Legionella massiliensis TaxID=1034943 RepID=A0A078KYF5_9GAMM|nr:GGDEF domain-containing protein [Legionella massiliensis]CDZ76783.1 Cyclic di-GMP phosphodiesterase Gmr [Legionella massiliensis]CEE12521.1 Cyclic di-GMP phosphodiesterase Gmr [Legionella massiliensis]
MEKMYLINQLKLWISELSPAETMNSRQYRLIHITSLELILVSFFLIFINVSWELWLMLYLVIAACFLIGINLALLIITKNTLLCGHILTFLAFVATSLANYWMGGISTSYFGWYYVVLIIAAVTINWPGLIIYSIMSLIMVMIFAALNISPIYTLSDSNALIMSFLNRSFSFFIIISSLYTLLRENTEYEKALWEHNYLLQADKDKFHYLARYDTLTNLPNRAYFQAYIDTLMEGINIKTHSVTVFYMDLDGLKIVNDRYGHDAGDSLLLQAGKRLQSCFRDNDFLARLGGDEFTAVISHLVDEQTPQLIAQRILQEFARSFDIDSNQIHSTISIGLATYPSDTVTVDQLINKADQAMYRAKKAGGNTYRNFAAKKLFVDL